VGENVGIIPDGEKDGNEEGIFVTIGAALEGPGEGAGEAVGEKLAMLLGEDVIEGDEVSVGFNVGMILGDGEGLVVSVGCNVGLILGDGEGRVVSVGFVVGWIDGKCSAITSLLCINIFSLPMDPRIRRAVYTI